MKKNDLPKAGKTRRTEEKLNLQKKISRTEKATGIQGLVHKMEVHQIEMKVQNQKLMELQVELEAAFRQYADLYDFAPFGYLTLARDGLIRQSNLAGANLLGVDHNQLTHHHLGGFASKESRPVYDAFFEKLLSAEGKEVCEVEFEKKENRRLWLRLEATCFDDGPECRVLMTDITARKQMASLLQARVRLSEYVEAHTFDELVQKTLDEAEALTGSLLGFAHFLDPDQNILKLQMWSTNTLKNDNTNKDHRLHYSIDQAGVWADCVIKRMPVIHNDYASLPHRKGLPHGHTPVLRELVVPVIRNDLVMMVMGVGNKSTDYDNNDVESLSQLANLAWDIVQRKQAEEVLRESEEKYRRLFDNAILGIFQSTPEGKAISVNNAFAHMFGYDSPEDTIKSIRDVSTDIFSDPNRRAEIIRLMAENPNLRTFENLYRRRDGTTFLGSLNTMPIRDLNGSLIRIEGIIEDITERKRTEKALRESQQLFSLFMHHSPIYAFIKEVTPTESRVLQASENYQEMIGIPNRNMIGKTMEELFPPEFAAKFTADDWSVITSGEVLKLDEDMNNRHYTTIKFPIIQGDKTLLAGYTIDITERVEAETAVKESELFIKGVLNSLTAHIAVLNEQGVIIAVNEAWIKFGRENGSLDSADYVGVNYLSACQSAIQQGDPIALQVDQGIRAVMDGTLPQFSTEYACHAPNQERWFVVTALSMHHSDQRVVVIHQNITESKQAELGLKHMKASLESANVELKAALARQEQLAQTDALTGVNNRRYLYELAEREFEVAVRYVRPLSVLMFDIDHFKDVNDTYGHAAGDRILQLVTHVACTELRAADVIGRYGGEEFVIVLPMTDAQHAYSLAERIRVGVAAIRVPTEKGEASVTLSIGIIELLHQKPVRSVEDLIRGADAVMYAAKEAGRNRTEIGGRKGIADV